MAHHARRNTITANTLLHIDAGNKLSDSPNTSSPEPTGLGELFQANTLDLNNILEDDLTPVDVSGDDVRRWLDLSGNNNHAEQLTISKQPQYTIPAASPTPLGVGVINANVTGATGLKVPLSLQPPFTVVFTGRAEVTGVIMGLIGGVACYITGQGSFIRSVSAANFDDFTLNEGSTANVAVWSWEVSDTTTRIFQNGVLLDSLAIDSSTVTSGNMLLGSNNDADPTGRGVFEEVWIFDSVITDNQRISVEDFQMARYGFGSPQIKDIKNPITRGSLVNGLVHNDNLPFDGVDDYVNLGNAVSSQTPALPISFEGWVNLADNATPFNYFRTDIVTGGAYYGIFVQVGAATASLRFLQLNFTDGTSINDTGRRTGTTGDIVPCAEWVHIGLVFTGDTNMEVYINGVVTAAPTYSGSGGALAWNNGDMLIGNFDSSLYLDGDVNTLKVYEAGLTAADFLQLYNATKNRF